MSDAMPSGDWSRSAAAQRQYNLVGGAILAAAGLALFATSFLLQNPVPLTVRGSVVIFIAVGIAISAGLLRVQNPQDVYGGMALMMLSTVTSMMVSADGMATSTASYVSSAAKQSATIRGDSSGRTASWNSTLHS